MSPAEGARPRTVQLKHNMEAIGAVLTFICRSSPYAEFRAAKIIAAVRLQLETGCHACLMQGGRIVGYAGWLTIRKEDAEAWLNGKVRLRPVPPSEADAAALTIVSVNDRKDVPQLIRACRTFAPQQNIYFKRDYAGGQERKSKVRAFRPGDGSRTERSVRLPE